MSETEYYILFPNVDNGLKLSEILKANKIEATIVPTPREASKCCGISILIRQKDSLTAVRECIRKSNINIIDIFELIKDRNPKRDKFC